MIRVVIPFGGDDPYRVASLRWVTEHLTAMFPDATIAVGRCEGVWSKAVAVADAIDPDWADTDILIVHDADVWIPQLDQTIRFLTHRPWVVPHRIVKRLNEDLSVKVLAGQVPFTGLGKQGWDQPPYSGVAGGGCVALPLSTYRHVPLDPRFEGWGQEDESWGFALTTMVGAPWRDEHSLHHFWHPHPPRLSRRIGSTAGERLANQYRAARRDPILMEHVLSAAR